MSQEKKPGHRAGGSEGRRASTSGPLRRPRERAFFSIGEVCDMVGVKPHVLRYWETQFDELSPSKNRSGNRVYRKEEIELISRIHQLVHEERYTVEGARKRLAELREADGEAQAEIGSVPANRDDRLDEVREDLAEILNLLSPPRSVR